MEFNKLKIIKKILHNLGVIDLEKAVIISNEITEEELSSFLLIFPIDKSDLIEINENIKRMLSDKMLMQITKVLDVIFEQTGIEINENNKELLLLSDEEYVDYKEKVKALFANKDFYDEQKITEVINLIKVKHFKMFLKLYDSENEEKTTTVSIAKELGVSDTTVIRIFTKIKEIIKEKTGIEINKSSHEKRKIEETDEDTYKRDFIEYFQMFGITSDSKLHALFSLIKQPEFRIFERAFPLDKKEKISQEKLAIYFNTPLTSLKKILQKIYGIIDELGIRFFENY